MAVGEPKATATRLGSYEILHMFARGGMAELFLARSIGLEGFEKLVVLKKILPSFAQNAKFVRLFLDEAKLAAGLDHPSIAHVYDLGMVDNNYFFTMEYVHGKDMRRVLQRSTRVGNVPIEHVVHAARSTAAALHYAHERGVVHRDVSPSNIVVSYEGAVKLLDFGVAKAATSTAKTRTGALKGKVSYMSPEQARGGALDRRSDIFSAGIVMWEMVATQRLFKAENDLATLQLVMHKPPPALTALRPDCPAELDRIIQRALAQDPEQRYQTAQALQRDLDELARETKLDQSPIALGAHMAVLFGPEIEAWQLAQAAGTSLADHVVAAAAVAAQEVTGGSQPFDDSDDDDNDEEPFVPPTQMTHVEVDAERTERTEPPVVAAPAPAPRRKRKKAKEPSGWKSEPSIVIEDALMTVGTPLPQAAPDVEPTAVTPTPRPARAQSPAARTQLVAAVAPPKRNNRWITVLALAVGAASAAVAYVVVSHDRAPNPAANVEPPKAAPASVLAEPAHAEPANVEPANSAPANAEPAKPAAKLEPAKPEPAKPEAAKLEPAKLEPAKPAAKLEPAKVAAPKPPRHVARPTPARHVDKPAPKPKFDPDAPLPPM